MLPNKGQVKHLPLLNNHFLNCIFNNPNYQKNPFKNTISKLSNNHNEYIILVPYSDILNENFEKPSSRISNARLLNELCYESEDFIQSHIIRTDPFSTIDRKSSQLFQTINGKQVLIKNGEIYTGKGFKKSIKVKITNACLFSSFSDYFPKGSKFQILYIDDALIASYDEVGNNKNLIVNSNKPGGNIRRPKVPEKSITFDMILRSFPALSTLISEKFYALFHHNNDKFKGLNLNNKKPLMTINQEFEKVLQEAYDIVSDCFEPDQNTSHEALKIIQSIKKAYPDLDLNKLIHEYVEFCLYDRIWAQVCLQFKVDENDLSDTSPQSRIEQRFLTKERYEALAHLSLNQLDIPSLTPWDYNELCSRIKAAIRIFSKFNDPSLIYQSAKLDILVSTLRELTNESTYSSIVVNADLLIGLLIMVVVHSKIDNIEAHMYYIKNFGYESLDKSGYFSYILSNFEAVLIHLYGNIMDSSSSANLSELSQKNANFIRAIERSDMKSLSEQMSDICQQLDSPELPFDSILRTRNIDGEDCLLIAIRTKNCNILTFLLNYGSGLFSIEDILFSKNVTDGKNLLQISLIEGSSKISRYLIRIITQYATEREQSIYFNMKDSTGRGVGHYLSHDYSLIDLIGDRINWVLKDENSHTPLFVLCRCYDHPSYDGLVKTVFDHVYNSNLGKFIDFSEHTDKFGNGLLHIVCKSLGATQLLSREKNLINLNQINNKQMTPLDVYVKYNRLDNMRYILSDNRQDIMFEDSIYHLTAFDYLMNSRAKASSRILYEDSQKVLLGKFFEDYFILSGKEKLAFVTGRVDVPTKDLSLFLADKAHLFSFKEESLEHMRQFLYFFKLQNKLSFFPGLNSFFLNFGSFNALLPKFKKIFINQLVEQLNIYIISLNIHPSFKMQRPLSNYLSNHKGKSIPDLIKIYAHNSSKNLAADINSNDLEAMDYFLKFSSAELTKFQLCLSKLNRLTAVLDIKNSELQYSETKLFKRFFASMGLKMEAFFKNTQVFPMDEYNNYDTALSELWSYLSWLEKCSSELLHNISIIRNSFLDWHKLKMELEQLQAELNKYSEITSLYSPNDDDASRNAPESSQQEELQNEVKGNDILSLFNFTSFVDSKKSKMKKTVMAIREKNELIHKLTCEIKDDYSDIATEISHFIKFRADFLKISMKIHSKKRLYFLRSRLVDTQKLFHSIRSV